MTSEIRVNKLQNRVGLGTVEYTNTGIVVSGIVTCTELSGLTALNIAGVGTANTLDINGDIDVDGHTNLDNVSIAGVTTISNNLTITSTNPKLIFNDTNGAPDYNINCEGGQLRFAETGGTVRLRINSDGHIDISENLDVLKDLDVDGHTNLDNVSIAGVTTFSGNVETYGLGSFKFNEDWSAQGRNVVVFPYNDTSPWFSFVGTNLRFTDGGNFVKPTDNKNANWGNIAGIVFEGTNQNTSSGNAPAIRFIGDLPGDSGLNISLGSGSSGKTAAIDNKTFAYFSGTGHFAPGSDSTHDLGFNGIRWRNLYADTLYGDGSNLTGITQTTINNNADNRIITGSGTANTLNGEASLTFDGSTLTQGGNNDSKLVLTGADNPYIRFRNASNTNRGYIQMHSNGNMYLVNQATSESLKIGSGAGGLTFTHDGSERVVAHQGYMTNDIWYLEAGKSYIGNWGQFENHGTYTDANTEPNYWGWSYSTGNTNFPNTNSTQWYRGRFSLGNGYGKGTDAGDYWMEITVPRLSYDSTSGQMYVRTCENGVENAWCEVGSRPRNHVIPYQNNSIDLGSSSIRWRNIYTNDLNLSNKGSTNSVDNTWGDYTIQEGESDLFLINNRNGKKYKFNLTEVS